MPLSLWPPVSSFTELFPFFSNLGFWRNRGAPRRIQIRGSVAVLAKCRRNGSEKQHQALERNKQVLRGLCPQVRKSNSYWLSFGLLILYFSESFIYCDLWRFH